MIYLLSYYVLINIYGFVKMAGDKEKAKRHEWRVPERTLMWLAVIGGAFGLTAAMNLFRHKTKHAKFKYGLPILCILHLIIFIYLFRILLSK